MIHFILGLCYSVALVLERNLKLNKNKQTNKKTKTKKADNDAKWLVHTGWFVRPCFLRNLTALRGSFYSVVKCRLQTAVTLQKKILTSFAFNSDVARTRNMISQKPILTTGAWFPWTVTVASPGRGLPCKVGLGILIENLDSSDLLRRPL